MRLAPASRLFSTSSLTTDAGRSTTSPAAIWSTSSPGSTRIAMQAVKFTGEPGACGQWRVNLRGGAGGEGFLGAGERRAPLLREARAIGRVRVK